MPYDLTFERLAPRSSLLVTIVVAFGCCPWSDAIAQVRRKDVSAWGLAIVTVPAGRKLALTLDGHVGLNDRARQPDRRFLRGAVSVRAADRVSLAGGVGYFHNDEPGAPRIRETRLFADVDFRSSSNPQKALLELRTRMERRSEASNPDTGWQLRQLVRVEVPLAQSERPLRLIVWHESFVSLKTTDWTGRRGTGSMFNFAGISVPLNSRLRFEPGYLNVTTFTPARNRLRHGPALIVVARL